MLDNRYILFKLQDKCFVSLSFHRDMVVAELAAEDYVRANSMVKELGIAKIKTMSVAIQRPVKVIWSE